MGNLAGKDGLGASGSHFDFFQTPPSSPSAPDLTGMPLPSSSSASSSSPPAHLPSPTTKNPSPSGGVVTPMTPSSRNSPVQAEDVLLMAEAGSEPPRGWGGGATTAATTTSASLVEGVSVSPVAAPEERRSPALPTPGWLTTPGEPQRNMFVGAGVALAGGGAMEGVVTRGVAVELLQVLEQHRAGLGLCAGQEGVAEVLGELKKLLTERAQFIQEVKSLKQTLESERAEWLQFQSDLQVAVAVADRLRMEAEESVLLLRLDQQEAADRLAATQERLQQAESDMEKLRRLYSEACRRLEEQEQQLKAQSSSSSRPLCLDQSSQTTAEADTEKTSYGVRVDLRDSGVLGTRDKTGEVDREGQEPFKTWRRPRSTVCLDQSTHSRGETTESTCGGVHPEIAAVRDSGGEETKDKKTEEVLGDGQTKDGKSGEERGLRKPEDEFVGKEEVRGSGRGVIDYERRTLPGFGLRDPRKIVMLSERSRSLSRLPLPSSSAPGQDGVSQNSLDAMAPASQGQDTGRESTGGRERMLDRLLQRQDSWSSFYTSKQDDDHGTDVSSVMISKVRSDDSFSLLLRRHGGSRRNSLLRWCQKRTQSYKNIDITNFSSSWEDGLAFCAVYHTYLPTHVPYSTLLPDNKKENLDLALRTGESVGIAATLTVEEMLRPGGPDWQRVLEYVESMFRHFEM